MRRKLEDTPEIFHFKLVLNEVQLDRLFGAIHYWKGDYPELQTVFDKLQGAVGFDWVPEYEIEDE